MAVPAHQRLRTQYDFEQVRSQGTRLNCGLFIVQYTVEDQLKHSRLGVIASRRVGNAVKRNYGKRVFRNLFRNHQKNLPLGTNLVMVLRSNFDSVPYAELEMRFLKACKNISENFNSEK